MTSLATLFEEAKVANFPPWFGEIMMESPDLLGDEMFRPRWHQVTGLNFTMLYDRAALYDEQGTGKSLIAQAWALWNAGMGNKVIILMPPVLLGQFWDTLKGTFKGCEKFLSLGVYKGTKAKRGKLYESWSSNWPDIVLMSYAIFREEWGLFSHFQALVADEAKLGNEKSATNVALTAFMGTVGEKNALVLNGTPANNDLRDLYGFIQFVTPGTYRSRLHFETLHVDYKSVPVRFEKRGEIFERSVNLVSGFRDLERLYKNLYKQARRVEKSQVLELKPKNIIPFTINLSEKHQQAYTKFCTELVLEFEDGTMLDGSSSAALRNHAMQAVMHPNILQVNEQSAVFEAIDHLLDTLLPSGKVPIFCHYRKTVEALEVHLKKYKPAVIYGGSNTEKEKDRFLKDPECKVAIVNYLSGGVGLNLQSVARDIICAEPTTVPGEFDQATDRVHRSGQKCEVNVYVLIPKGTLFVKAVSNMVKKKIVIGQVVSRDNLLRELKGEDVDYGGTEITSSPPPSDPPAPEMVLAPGWNVL